MFLLNKAIIKDNPEIHKEKHSSVHKHGKKSSEGSFSEVFNKANKKHHHALNAEKNLNPEKETSVEKHSHAGKNKTEKSLKVSADFSAAERCLLLDKEVNTDKPELKEAESAENAVPKIQVQPKLAGKELISKEESDKTENTELNAELLSLAADNVQIKPKLSETNKEEFLSEKQTDTSGIKENLPDIKQQNNGINKQVATEPTEIKPADIHMANNAAQPELKPEIKENLPDTKPQGNEVNKQVETKLTEIKPADIHTANITAQPELKPEIKENLPDIKPQGNEVNKQVETKLTEIKPDIKPAVNLDVNNVVQTETKTDENKPFKGILKAESTKTDEEPRTVKTDSKEILIARSIISAEGNTDKSSLTAKKESLAEDKVSVKPENNAGIPAQKNENSLKQHKDNNFKDKDTQKIQLKPEKSDQSDKQIQEKPSFALPNNQNDTKTVIKENSVVLNLLQDTMFKGTDINTVMQSIKNNENPEIKDIFSNNLTKFVADKTFELIKNAQIENNKLTITIKPDNLGKIEINLTSTGGILSAEINADSQDVKNILSNGLDTLKNSLAEKGLTLDKVTVNFNQTNMQNNNRNDFAQEYNSLNKSGYDFNSQDNKSNGESYPYAENKSNTGSEIYESVLDFNEEISNDNGNPNVTSGRIDYRI